MPVPADLLEAYERTEYRVDDCGHAFVLRIGESSPDLRVCHAAFGVTCSTFITAWNPRSQPTPLDVNEAALARLIQDVTSRGLVALRGLGADPLGTWEPEPSVLVPGLGEQDGLALARAYDQYAIVVCGADATPRLVVAL